MPTAPAASTTTTTIDNAEKCPASRATKNTAAAYTAKSAPAHQFMVNDYPRSGAHMREARPPEVDGLPGEGASYRYWPVLVAVSIARPDSWFLPVTRVRM
ncbi:hypothetical protein GCM10010492_07560 [Saccharothrix mutabilis subsp. mutabilis]|uniref:Uncharacterized protein n=1 Tax=Saccharothrix mutabilis subsp. mutabilis TaxID=66855 RepID=A0ABN0T4G9_9PSEU